MRPVSGVKVGCDIVNSYAKIGCLARYGSFPLDQMKAHLELVVVYLSSKYNGDRSLLAQIGGNGAGFCHYTLYTFLC